MKATWKGLKSDFSDISTNLTKGATRKHGTKSIKYLADI